MVFQGRHFSAGVKAAGAVGTLVILVTIACHILCLSTPFYFVLHDSDIRRALSSINLVVDLPNNFTFDISYGLWMICVNGGPPTDQDKCYHIQFNSSLEGITSPREAYLPEWLVAPRVLSIVGLLLQSTAALSLIAFVCTKLEKMPNLFLVSASVTSIMGGIIILSSDISFAAEKTISFYSYKPMDSYLFPKSITSEKTAYLILEYDNHFVSGWSFILDLISGALSIAIGPVFMFIVIKLQEAEDREDKQRLDKLTPFSHESTKITSL